MPKRQFFQYELNWLKKYGFNLKELDSIGETPVEYVTGHAQFLELDFRVDSHTLIPRIETEEIIPLATKYLASLPKGPLQIADIGTGSGCIGISLADNLIELNILDFDLYLSDISKEALAVARDNLNTIIHNPSPRIHLLKSHLLNNYPSNIRFHLITANLPYIPSLRIPTLDSSVKDYEPVSALDGGADGTELINELLESISSHLAPDFLVILEIDSTHTLDMFHIPKGITAKIQADDFERPRFLILTPR